MIASSAVSVLGPALVFMMVVGVICVGAIWWGLDGNAWLRSRRQYGREIHKRDHHCHLPVVASSYPQVETMGSTFTAQGWDVGDEWVCNECLTVWEVEERWPGSIVWEWNIVEQGAGRL